MTPFRPRLDRLDDRLTPTVSPTQVFDALHQSAAGNQVLGFIADNPHYLVQRVYQPFARQVLKDTADRNDAGVAVLDQFLSDLRTKITAEPTQAAALTPFVSQVAAAKFQAQTVAAVARLDLNYVNQALGIVEPPPGTSPPPPPPAVDLTSDSGMTNTVPDVTASGFREVSNGVRVKDVSVGTGPAVQPGATVQVYYTGYLTNGTVFDSRRSPQPPATFALGEVVPGFAAGLIGMQPGGVRDIVIPADQGYGNRQVGTIPPNSTLIFQVKLISVTNPG